MKGLLFTYLLTYGGAAASLFNPYYGLLIYVCFAVVKPEALWYWSVPEGNYSRIVALALLAGWLAKGLGDWRFRRARGVAYAFIAYFLWSVAGAIIAPNQAAAWLFVENLAKIVLPFLVGLTIIDSVAKLKQLAWVLLLSQGYVAYDMNVSYYEGFNRPQIIGFAGLDNNSIAISMVTGVGLAFFLGLHTPKWWAKAVAFLAAALQAHVVLFSFSRGGMLALIITGFVAFLLIPKTPKHFLALLLAVLLGLRLAGTEVRERFMTSFTPEGQEREGSAQSRLDLWANCWDAMLKRPVFGVGPDHWPLIVHEYGWEPGKEAHTLWLQVGAEQGFPGLGFLALFYGLCCAGLWPLTYESRPVSDEWHRATARMVIASIIGFAVAAQFVTLEGLELPYYITLLGAGALKLCRSPEEAAAEAGTGEAPALPSENRE